VKRALECLKSSSVGERDVSKTTQDRHWEREMCPFFYFDFCYGNISIGRSGREMDAEMQQHRQRHFKKRAVACMPTVAKEKRERDILIRTSSRFT
jgi:hypothetical protein